VRYSLSHPIQYLGMEWRKFHRLWLRPSRVGANSSGPSVTVVHLVLVSASVTGLLFGLLRRRSAALTAIMLVLIYGTAVHLLTASDTRYNVPLTALLFAGGAAGALGGLASRRTGPQPTPVGSASHVHHRPPRADEPQRSDVEREGVDTRGDQPPPAT
jgi:hypothetical protein